MLIFHLDVNEKGLMLAKRAGKTRITLKAVGLHPIDGAQVIYSEVSTKNTVKTYFNIILIYLLDFC